MAVVDEIDQTPLDEDGGEVRVAIASGDVSSKGERQSDSDDWLEVPGKRVEIKCSSRGDRSGSTTDEAWDELGLAMTT